ncbi:MAG: BglG family transcription antiterminator [Clostridia bacterium]
MVTLTYRQRNIIVYLAQSNSYLTIKNIADHFDVSERTIRYELDVVENYLKEKNLIKKPKLGVKLDCSAEEKELLMRMIQSFDCKVLSPEERVYLIMIYLICSDQGITIEGFTEKLYVNKNTILADLNTAEDKVKAFGLCMNKKSRFGIMLEGEEECIRNFFVYSHYEGLKNALITNDDLKKLLECDWDSIANAIKLMEENLDIRYSDTSSQELEMCIGYIIMRSQHNRHIDYSDEILNKYRKQKEFGLLLNNKYLDKTTLNESDICYILKLFMGAKIVYSIDIGDNMEESSEAKILSKQIIQDAEEYLGLDFSNDFAFINGLAIHLKVAVHRIRNGLFIENPLTEQIKYRITFIYEMTKKILAKHSKMIHITFPEEEVAFIAMHIGAAFEKSTQSGFMPKVLVICGSGYATAGILSTRLNIMLPELRLIGPANIHEAVKIAKDANIDFVISTVDFYMEGYTVIKVNPLLDVEDLENIKKNIYIHTYSKQSKYLANRYKDHSINGNSIQDIIPIEHTRFNVETNDWRQAIKIASEPLAKRKYITLEYVSAMIKAVEELGPYMAFIPGIAMAHASPEAGVNQECISMINLKKEIELGDIHKAKVKTIVVFAARESSTNVLTSLVNILEKDDNIEKFKKAVSYEEIKLLDQTRDLQGA